MEDRLTNRIGDEMKIVENLWWGFIAEGTVYGKYPFRYSYHPDGRLIGSNRDLDILGIAPHNGMA